MSAIKDRSKALENALAALKEEGADASSLAVIEGEIKALRSAYDEKVKEMERFQIMFDWSPCTLSWIDHNLNYLGVNKALCDIFKLPAEDFIGKEVGSHSKQAFFREFSKELFNIKEDTHSLELTVNIKGQDRSFYLLGTKFKQGNEAIIIGLDVTELVHMEKSMALMERLSSLGEMVAGIVHEINNPLTVIKNRAHRIPKLLKLGDIERAQSDAESINATCTKIEKIIHGVKTFVRHGQDDPRTIGDLRDSLDQAVLMLESKLKNSFIKVTLPKESIPNVLGNHTQFYQVFVNLLSNSIDALNDGAGRSGESISARWIHVEYEERDEEHCLRFIDSGFGIPKEKQNQIFDSFYTSKLPGMGTGLGLSLCKKILDLHGGNIAVDNEHKNTCFVVTIPKAKAIAA